MQQTHNKPLSRCFQHDKLNGNKVRFFTPLRSVQHDRANISTNIKIPLPRRGGKNLKKFLTGWFKNVHHYNPPKHKTSIYCFQDHRFTFIITTMTPYFAFLP